MGDKLLFFKSFLSNPATLGSIAPSGKWLVKDLLAGVDFERCRTIVEYGAGTGVFTDEIVRRLHPEARFLTIELNDDLYASLKDRYHDPRVHVVHGSAADVQKYLAEFGMAQPEAIVSGLPFTSLPDDLRHEILVATVQTLAPGGRFFLYQYTTLLYGLLQRYFEAIHTRWTFWNVPPAFSFYCERPRLPGGQLPGPRTASTSETQAAG